MPSSIVRRLSSPKESLLPARDYVERLESNLRLRLQVPLSLSHVPFVRGEMEGLLVGWLDGMLPPEETARLRDFSIGVSISADLDKLTWRVAGATEQFLPRVRQYIQDLGTPDEEAQRLDNVVSELNPAQIGGWIEATPDGIDGGWYLPEEFSMEQVLKFVGDSKACEKVQAWARGHLVDMCQRLERAAATDSPYTRLLLALPGDGKEQQLAAGLDLFLELSVQAPPEMALQALRDAAGPLGLCVGLSATGTVSLGLLGARPETRQVVQMSMALGIENDRALAAFEGSMGVQGATYLEYCQAAEGPFIELHYF